MPDIAAIVAFVISFCNVMNYFGMTDPMAKLDVEKKIMLELEKNQAVVWVNLEQKEDFRRFVRNSNHMSVQELEMELNHIL